MTAISVALMIKIVVFALVVFAVILQTYEGAFAQGPGLEAHGIELSVRLFCSCGHIRSS